MIVFSDALVQSARRELYQRVLSDALALLRPAEENHLHRLPEW
jgi:hypothetical protein